MQTLKTRAEQPNAKNPFSDLKGDLRGGITVAAVALPGNIIFGMIAFAPLGGDFISQGILAAMFASIFGGIIAAIFGGTPFMISGPQAAPAIILANLLGELSREIGMTATPDTMLVLYIVFSCIFFSGVLQLLFGFLRLGEVVKFISYPVAVGVINGVAVLIIIGQAGALLGLPGISFFHIAFHLEEVVLLAPLVSVITLLCLITADKLSSQIPAPLLAIIIGTGVYHLFSILFPELPQGPTIGSIPSGLPNPENALGILNTITDTAFFNYLPLIIKGALALAVINSLDSLLSALMLQNLTNNRTNANKELIGQGLGNIVSPLLGGLTSSGFIGRSMANFRAGGRTKFSPIIHSLSIFIVIALFARYISYIPRSVIAAVIIFIGVRLIDPFSIRLLQDIIQKKKAHSHMVDLGIIIIVMITAIAFDIPIALGVGVLLSFIVFLSAMSKGVVHKVYTGDKLRSRKMREDSLSKLLDKHGETITVLELEGTLFFAAAEVLADYIDRLKSKKFIILDIKKVHRIDTTGYRILEQSYKRLKEKGIVLAFSYLYDGRAIMTEFKNLNLHQEIDSAHIFSDTDKALEYCEDSLLDILQINQQNEKTYSLNMFLSSYGFSKPEADFIKNYLEYQVYPAGSSVFVQGDAGNSLFLIVSGEADITISLPGGDRKKRMVTLTYGTVFGEMALIDEKLRSANVDVMKDLECYKLPVDSFHHIKQENPEMAIKIITVISKILTQRLRNANNMISQQET
ncbi:MAG: SLC26A/SulP transporter family protein [Spirochaetia bacterium]